METNHCFVSMLGSISRGSCGRKGEQHAFYHTVFTKHVCFPIPRRSRICPTKYRYTLLTYPHDVSVSSLFGKQPNKHIEYCNSFLCGGVCADGLQSAKPHLHRASAYRTSKDVYELETSKLSLASDRCALTRYHTGHVQRLLSHRVCRRYRKT